MNDIALYPGGRRTGKTTMLVQQVRQAAIVGQDVAVMVPNASRQQDFYDEMRDWDEDQRPVAVFTEAGIHRTRGYRFDHIFIDDADLFEDSPIEMAAYYHPGVPLTVTYTPFAGSSLPRENKK